MQRAGFANHFHNDFSAMEHWAGEALKLFNQTPNKKQIEIAYWQLGAALFRQFRYKEAEPYLEQSYYWAEKKWQQRMEIPGAWV
jgi:hypothetical protein